MFRPTLIKGSGRNIDTQPDSLIRGGPLRTGRSLPADYLELALAALRLPGADVAAHTMLRAVLTMRGWRVGMILRDELAPLPVPTLFVWGDSDAFAPPSSGTDMVARMPNAEIEIVPDAGHKPYLDRPTAVADIINAFLHTAPSVQSRKRG